MFFFFLNIPLPGFTTEQQYQDALNLDGHS